MTGPHVWLSMLALTSSVACHRPGPIAQELLEEFRCPEPALEVDAGVPLTFRVDEKYEGHSGQDLDWRVDLGHCAGRNRIWKLDLDGDGRLELAIEQNFPYNGWCSTLRVFVPLPFDERGLPIPWRLGTTYAEGEHLGPNLDIVSWDPSGQATALQTECYWYEYRENGLSTQTEWIEAPFGWVATYRFDRGRWYRLQQAAHAVLRQSHLAEASRLGREIGARPTYKGTFVPDYTNVMRGTGERRIVEVLDTPKEPCPLGDRPRYGDYDSSDTFHEAQTSWRKACGYQFRLDSGQTCVGQPVVVLDEGDGRRAAIEGEPSVRLLKIARDGKYLVELAGQTEENLCSPSTVWATAP